MSSGYSDCLDYLILLRNIVLDSPRSVTQVSIVCFLELVAGKFTCRWFSGIKRRHRRCWNLDLREWAEDVAGQDQDPSSD